MTLAARPESSGTPLAVALVIMASALIAATSIIAKQLGIDGDDAPGLSPFQVSAGRFFFAFSGLILFMSFQPKFRPSFKGAKWRFHITRALFGWMGVTCMFTAVARMPVADATAIGFLNLICLTSGFAVGGEEEVLRWTFQFMDFELVFGRIDKFSLLFGHIFSLLAVVALIQAAAQERVQRRRVTTAALEVLQVLMALVEEAAALAAWVALRLLE